MEPKWEFWVLSRRHISLSLNRMKCAAAVMSFFDCVLEYGTRVECVPALVCNLTLLCRTLVFLLRLSWIVTVPVLYEYRSLLQLDGAGFGASASTATVPPPPPSTTEPVCCLRLYFLLFSFFFLLRKTKAALSNYSICIPVL